MLQVAGAAAVRRVDTDLRRVLPAGIVVSVRSPLVLDERSVPEPDVAVVPGVEADYDRAHPTTAWLVVEVADRSLAQDRITKTRIYAGAGIPEVWIVHLRDDRIEVLRDPDAAARVYGTTSIHARGEVLRPVAFPAASIAVDEPLPRPAG